MLTNKIKSIYVIVIYIKIIIFILFNLVDTIAVNWSRQVYLLIIFTRL